MSTGLVICSNCRREVHQDGDKGVENGWRHCEDKTPICAVAHAAYPEAGETPRGEWCGRDADLMTMPMGQGMTPRSGTSIRAAAVSLAAMAMNMPVSAFPVHRMPKIRRGNKYRLCECGSHEPWANCCGKKV